MHGTSAFEHTLSTATHIVYCVYADECSVWDNNKKYSGDKNFSYLNNRNSKENSQRTRRVREREQYINHISTVRLTHERIRHIIFIHFLYTLWPHTNNRPTVCISLCTLVAGVYKSQSRAAPRIYVYIYIFDIHRLVFEHFHVYTRTIFI